MKRAISLILLAALCLALLVSCAPQQAAEETAAAATTQPQHVARHIDAGGARIAENSRTGEEPAEATVEKTAQPEAQGTSGNTVQAAQQQGQGTVNNNNHSETAHPAATPAPKPAPTPTASVSSASSPGATATPGATAPAQTTKPGASTPKATSNMTCTIAIDCTTAVAVEPALANAVSSNGIILSETTITLENGQTVYDALAASGVIFAGSASYITSINSIGEGDCGAGSGWMYSVNGTFPKAGCNQYKLQDGDKVAWRYSCNTGKDIGAGF